MQPAFIVILLCSILIALLVCCLVLRGFAAVLSSSPANAGLRSSLLSLTTTRLRQIIRTQSDTGSVLPGHSFELVRPALEEHMDDFLRNKLNVKMPMIGMFIGDKTIGTLKEIFIEEIELIFPKILSQITSGTGHSGVQHLVEPILAGLDTPQFRQELRTALKPIIYRSLWLAAFTGFLGGIVQVLLIRLIS